MVTVYSSTMVSVCHCRLVSVSLFTHYSLTCLLYAPRPLALLLVVPARDVQIAVGGDHLHDVLVPVRFLRAIL